MQFSCETQAFLGGLSIVTRVLSVRTTQPILEGVLLRTTDEGLQLTCSDGSVSVVTTIAATISEEGSVVLPGKLLFDVIRRMPDAEIVARVSNTFVASLSCLGVRMSLAGQSGELYPALPLVSAENSFIVPQTVLRDMINETAFAIAIDDPRKVLNGCLIEIARGEARMVALDGFRLALRLERLSSEADGLSAIIPGRTVQEIAKILVTDESKMAMILMGGSQMMVNLGETCFYSTLIEGEFIDYRKILPTSFKTHLTFDKERLADCVDRASLIARQGKNNLVKFEITENQLIITANSESGDAYEELDVEVEGEPLTIAFNVNYVADVLRVLPGGESQLMFNSPVSPCLVSPAQGDAFTYLMLPVRVNA